MAVPSKRPTSERRSFPSDRTRTLRRRAQRAAVREPERQHYASIEQRLTFIADELTTAEDEDLRAELLKVIRAVRLRGASNEMQDYELVLEAIRKHQCYCVYDIYDQTRISKAQIWKILDGLIATGQVCQLKGGSSIRERDEYDTLFNLTGSPSFSPSVRP